MSVSSRCGNELVAGRTLVGVDAIAVEVCLEFAVRPGVEGDVLGRVSSSGKR